jgi:hypothetical protein
MRPCGITSVAWLPALPATTAPPSISSCKLRTAISRRLLTSAKPSAGAVNGEKLPLERSAKRRFFAVLHQPPVDSPQAAARAATVAEHRSKVR